MLITEDYKKLNAELHVDNPGFGTMASALGIPIGRLCEKHGFRSVLDYGCGKGTLAPVLSAIGLTVHEYDPAIPGKDADPPAADLVVCIDVMEHVEAECIDDVLTHIASLSNRLAYFMIDNGPAKKTLPDGRNAHLTIQGRKWWKQRLSEYFKLSVCAKVDEFTAANGDRLRIPHGATIAVGTPLKST